MSLLAVTRALVSFTNPTEAQFDTIRSELLAYFNAASMTEANVAAGGALYTSLSRALDNESLLWTGSVSLIRFISATPTFSIENSSGALVFSNKAVTTEVESLRLATTGTMTLGIGGILKTCLSRGLQSVDTMWLLANYRKPLLEYTSADVVSVSDNGPTATQTLIVMRDRVCSIYDRTMSLAANANGYDSADVGTAVSGIRDGLVRAVNTWYYVYAVRVRYGTQADGIQAILVADTTSPIQANVATLNTQFGTDEWVYMGLIRNGYNDGVNTNVIIPFTYDGYGLLQFTTTTETGKGQGLRLATATASSLDLTYTLTFGVGASDMPVIATRVTFTCFRSADAFIADYVNISSGEILAQATSCADTDTTSSTIAAVYMDVPLINGYNVVVRVGTAATDNRIRLASLVDHYV